MHATTYLWFWSKGKPTQNTHTFLLLSLVWLCCTWSWVKERGCKPLTRPVSLWRTTDGKRHQPDYFYFNSTNIFRTVLFPSCLQNHFPALYQWTKLIMNMPPISRGKHFVLLPPCWEEPKSSRHGNLFHNHIVQRISFIHNGTAALSQP